MMSENSHLRRSRSESGAPTPGAVWGWFIAWMVLGVLASFGVAALPSVGLFVLPVAVVAAAALGKGSKGKGWEGFLSGAGITALWVAYENRYGPGEYCASADAVTSCSQQLNPAPFLALGLLGVALGLLLGALRYAQALRPAQPSHRRSQGPSPA